MTHDALAPLLRWSLSAEGPVLEPAIRLTRGLVPSLEGPATEGLKKSVRYALESEYVRTLAKETVHGAILGKINALQEAQRRRDEELRRQMRRREQGLPAEEEKEQGAAAGSAQGEEEEEQASSPPAAEDRGNEAQEGYLPAVAVDEQRHEQGQEQEAAAAQMAMEQLRRAREAAFDKAEEH
jgi:hypothetical protein